MAFAALLPNPHPDVLVALVEPGSGEIRERAVRVHSSLREKFRRLGLPRGHSCKLALEWQRPLKTDKRPQNISDLSAFAGIALAVLQVEVELLSADRLDVYTPLPEEWKGQVPKHVKHNRIVAEAGGAARVAYTLERAGIPVPKDLGRFTREFTGMAGNALDAIGLALWAQERHRLQLLSLTATMKRPQ